MKRLVYSWAVLAAALLIFVSSCNPKATEDELNDFQALAEANDDSLQSELNALRDSIESAQNRNSVNGNLTGTFADSDEAFSIDYNLRYTDEDYNYMKVYEQNDTTFVRVNKFFFSTPAGPDDYGNGESKSGDYLNCYIIIDLDNLTLVEIDDIDGQFSQKLSNESIFIYEFDYDQGDPGNYNISNISYDDDTEILTFDYNLSWTDGAPLGKNNTKAASLTGTLSVFVSRTYDNIQYRQ
ncbi:MAG: hypothetical protein ACFB0B_19625 [Thermonemataceae bacterium]